VRIDRRARDDLERAISTWSGARAGPRGGGAEVWVIRRRDERDISLSVRLDSGSVEKVPKGSLKPDLAAALVRTVAVRDDEVVFDPFAGSGAIPRARARYPYAHLFATDIDRACVRGLEETQRRGHLGERARVGRLDVRDTASVVSFLGSQPVDTVLTDPPWGLYASRAANIGQLYEDTFATMQAILNPTGRVVLLTAAAPAAREPIHQYGFELADSFPVLVNGKKASVLVATRTA
jgi:tRNA G10  N-methylase Trm11